MSTDGRRGIDALLAEVRAGLDRVGPAEAAAVVSDGGVLVDIRPLESRRGEGHIPGAWIVDRNVLEWRLDPMSPDRLAGVDEGIYDRPVVIVCNEGYASSLAAATLKALGLRRAGDLDGGYRAWAAAGLPVEDGPGTPA